jgi:hypothetical protein
MVRMFLIIVAVRYEVLTLTSTKTPDFFADVSPCSLVDTDQWRQ